jgi:hypothetical protein
MNTRPGSLTQNYLPTFDYLRLSLEHAAELGFHRLSSLGSSVAIGRIAD